MNILFWKHKNLFSLFLGGGGGGVGSVSVRFSILLMTSLTAPRAPCVQHAHYSVDLHENKILVMLHKFSVCSLLRGGGWVGEKWFSFPIYR